MGGETRVTETQIKEEKNKYDAKRRESKKVKADESNASNEEPTKAPVKASVESNESDDDADPFELEEDEILWVEKNNLTLGFTKKSN